MSATKELAYWLKLTLESGLGSRKIATLLSTFKTAESICTAGSSALKATGIVEQTAISKLRADTHTDRIQQALQWQQQDNHHIVSLNDPLYPPLLKATDHPPLLLYIKGDAQIISEPQLAIVGSRNPTESGKQNAYEFAKYLSQSGLIISSGLALGIDAACHLGALAANAPTIAVVATGMDQVYPAKHKELANTILQKNGAILSEFPLGTKPRPELFPQRNRIISGLSLGTLVVEAAIKSGSLITARHAIEQSREVFAIPGSIHNPLSRGCHKLIRDGAKLVENAQDILEELAPSLKRALEQIEKQNPSKSSTAQLDQNDQLILDKMGFDPATADELINRSALPTEIVTSALMMLELKGIITQNPDGRYCRLANNT